MSNETTADSPEIRAAFLADHQRLNHLLEKLSSAFQVNDREDMQELWGELEAGLSAHLDAEEAVLIPALARSNRTEADALLKEHESIRGRLADLGPGVDLHVVRSEVVRAFIDELRAHAAREDRTLYAWGDAHVSPAERASLLGTLKRSVRRALAESKARHE